MTTYSFYCKETGLFIGRTYNGPHDHLQINTPKDCAAMEGKFDYLSARVDLHTCEVISYEPLPPSVAEIRQQETEKALTELLRLETQQHRYVAEKVSGTIDAEGERRLAAILARKAELRTQLIKAN